MLEMFDRKKPFPFWKPLDHSFHAPPWLAEVGRVGVRLNAKSLSTFFVVESANLFGAFESFSDSHVLLTLDSSFASLNWVQSAGFWSTVSCPPAPLPFQASICWHFDREKTHHFFHFFLDFDMMFLQQVSILLGFAGKLICSLELNFYEPWMSPWRDAVKNGMARSSCCRKDSTRGQTVECCAEFVWNSSTPCLASDYHDTADWLEVWNALFEDAYLSRLSGWAHFLCLAVGKKPSQQKWILPESFWRLVS